MKYKVYAHSKRISTHSELVTALGLWRSLEEHRVPFTCWWYNVNVVSCGLVVDCPIGNSLTGMRGSKGVELAGFVNGDYLNNVLIFFYPRITCEIETICSTGGQTALL